MMITIASLVAIAAILYVLAVRARDLPAPEPVSPFQHLDERKAAIYDNLRDLQFEYRVGKLSDADYQATKTGLQKELAAVMAEVDRIKAGVAPAAPAPDPHLCPHCGAKFKDLLKFCGQCGKPMAALLLFVALALPVMAIDGIVINKTTGQPAANATVTLIEMGQGGMTPEGTVRTDAQGKFSLAKDSPGTRLVQVTFDGVTYSQMVQPGAKELSVDVYNASKQRQKAQIGHHFLVFQPSGGQMTVSEGYIFNNPGQTTWHDPDAGTLRFYLPPAAKGIVQVSATAPNGMPVQRTAEKTAKPNIYKVDFPIKPGETRFELTYIVPYQDGGAFESKVVDPMQGPTYLVAPEGVTLKGADLGEPRQEPQSKAAIYAVNKPEIKVELAGALSETAAEAQESSGPEIEQIRPKVWDKAIPILALTLGILALGFALLYRAGEGSHAGHGRG